MLSATRTQLPQPGGATTGPARVQASTAAAKPKSLALHEVSKNFGSVTALHPTSLEVKPGELVALLGPSGCGKTTTLRLIAGFEYSDTGRVTIGGVDVTQLPPNKRGLGMVFQNYSLFPHMSVAENIAFGLRMAGVARGKREDEARRMLDLIRLPQYGDRQVSQLSGGQQQRVALARAIVTNPSVLLLDEPLGALDKNLREGMQLEIRQLQQRLGITSVIVTHDQEEAMTMSDRIIVMSHGRVLQSGAPREVYERPRTRFVAEFLGTANIFDSSVLSTAAGPQGRCEVAVRPEKILLDSQSDLHVHFPGRVKEHVFRGSQHVYLVDVPALDAPIYVYRQAVSGHVGHEKGEAVQVSFDPRDAVFLETDEVRA